MNRERKATSLLVVLLLIFGSCDIFENKSGVTINEDIWVNGFLASWHHNPETETVNSGLMTNDQIDWDGLTHLTYYSLSIDSLGQPSQSMNPADRRNFNTDRLESIVPAAHANGVNILFSIGSDGTEDGMSQALSDENRPQLIRTITDIIIDYGFDGVHLNILQMGVNDFANYRKFVRELSLSFDTMRTARGNRPLITTVAPKSEDQLRFFADHQNYFDQIHILTYEMVQPWRAWMAWHGSALYNHNVVFEVEPGRLLPSADEFVVKAIGAGIERKKIGIAISFYAQVWLGVYMRERWDEWPTQNMSIMWRTPYSELRDEFPLHDYNWDDNARVPYLHTENPKMFVSYENEQSVQEKVQYAEKKRIGGVMIWEIGGGYLEGGGHPLLRSVRESTFQYRNREP